MGLYGLPLVSVGTHYQLVEDGVGVDVDVGNAGSGSGSGFDVGMFEERIVAAR